MAFDKSKLKDFKDTKIEKVDCPEWAEMGDIYVRSMTGSSRDNYEMATYHASQVDEKVRVYNMRAEMVVATACDEDGNLLFDKADIVWLGQKSGAVLDRLFDAAQKLAGIGAKDLEEMEKSLETDQN
jgi:hypothetical protein